MGNIRGCIYNIKKQLIETYLVCTFKPLCLLQWGWGPKTPSPGCQAPFHGPPWWTPLAEPFAVHSWLVFDLHLAQTTRSRVPPCHDSHSHSRFDSGANSLAFHHICRLAGWYSPCSGTNSCSFSSWRSCIFGSACKCHVDLILPIK